MLLEGIWGKTIQRPIYIWHMNQPSYCELCFSPPHIWLNVRLHSPSWNQNPTLSGVALYKLNYLKVSPVHQSVRHSVVCDWHVCNPMDCSPPGSSVHGIFQARILEWVAISSSRGSSQPRDRTWVSCIEDRFFTMWPTREAHNETIPGFSISRNCDEVSLIVLIVY